ncbi:MAG: hypothetical protein EBX41_06610 [Chitinophagia bacterium]|nr:hypothetical protein [Chitinophagia bacterium]
MASKNTSSIKRNIIIFCSGSIFAFGLVAAMAYIPKETKETEAPGRNTMQWYPPELPTQMDFCGEKIPLEKQDAKEKFERELLSNYYHHAQQLYMLKLAGRAFPIIEPILKREGVPNDIKYLCVAESSLLLNAVSNVGAASYWQFMKPTAAKYALEVNEDIDERYNIEKATAAAAKYLLEYKNKLGSWTAAAAAYNCGGAGYQKQVDYQGSSDFYELQFTEETNRYVFRIAALKYLLTNAKKMGHIIESNDEYKPLPVKTIEVKETIPDLATWAKDNNITYKTLKTYNPWLRSHKLPVKPGKTYVIQLPK